MRSLSDRDFDAAVPLTEEQPRLAERHLSQAEEQLRAQRDQVAVLRRQGRDAAPAMDLVRSLERTVAEYRAFLTLQRAQAADHSSDL